jgi:ribosomal protein S18 acetylase RimI-like enzyme
MVLSGIWKRHDNFKEPPPNLVTSHLKDISPEEVQDICSSVGWCKRDPSLISQALNNSLAVVSVWDKDKMVGFARATGDKVFNATVWDVVVRPSYQRLGVGQLVMRELLNDLDQYDIPLITLYADPGTDGFYKRFGFLADPSGVRGMFREKI